jgi:hypothetical protein
MNKAQQQVAKAKESVAGNILDIADTIDDAIVEATAIGGKISQIVPPHLQSHIDRLTALADQISQLSDQILSGSGQSSLATLKDAVINMPVKDVMPKSAEERRSERKGNVDLTPNTAQGPQTAMKESWRDMTETEYPGRGLSWERLQESNLFGSKGDDEFGLSEWTNNAPIDQFSYRRKIREAVDRDDLEDLGDRIQESLDGRGHFDWKQMKSPIGSIDNSGMDFSSLKSTGKDGMNLSQITVAG